MARTVFLADGWCYQASSGEVGEPLKGNCRKNNTKAPKIKVPRTQNRRVMLVAICAFILSKAVAQEQKVKFPYQIMSVYVLF